jgi:hypothetical protein
MPYQLNIAFCMVASNRTHNQPDDGLEKYAETCSLKTPNVRYMNKAT